MEYIKSEFINHWLPNFKYETGDNLTDALETVRKHVWAYRANRTIKRANRKLSTPLDRKTEKRQEKLLLLHFLI